MLHRTFYRFKVRTLNHQWDLKQLINQESIKQSINQPIDSSINQSINITQFIILQTHEATAGARNEPVVGTPGLVTHNDSTGLGLPSVTHTGNAGVGNVGRKCRSFVKGFSCIVPA